MNPTTASAPALPERERRSTRLLRYGLAALFLAAGIAKLAGIEIMRSMFEHFGYPQDFRLLVGAVESAGAIGLLIPRLAFGSALVLGAVMIGAIASHLLRDPVYMALPAAATLALLLVVAWRHAKLSDPRRRMRAPGGTATPAGRRAR